MTGLVGLHGGGEYVAGDEATLDALVAAAATMAGDAPIRIVILPTAAARQRPELAGAHGRDALARAAQRTAHEAAIDVLLVTDEATAADSRSTERLAAAHLIHLPGGDPDRIPAILGGSPAWAAIRDAHARGAVIAGASAGAMALGERCWTPRGAVAGLRLVPGIAVAPHLDRRRLARWRAEPGEPAESGEPADPAEPDEPDGRGPAAPVTWIGIDERTMLLGRPGEPAWQVIGAGRVVVIDPDGTTRDAPAGTTIRLPT